MEWTAVTALMSQVTCEKMIACYKWKNWKRTKGSCEEDKLIDILCSVNCLVMCSAVKLTFLCYIPW